MLQFGGIASQQKIASIWESERKGDVFNFIDWMESLTVFFFIGKRLIVNTEVWPYFEENKESTEKAKILLFKLHWQYPKPGIYDYVPSRYN